MFNSLFRQVSSHGPKSHSLPIHSHQKSKKNCHTPFKSLITTNHTNNPTLSMYSFNSRSKSLVHRDTVSVRNKTKNSKSSHPAPYNMQKIKQRRKAKSSTNANKRSKCPKNTSNPKNSYALQQEKVERTLKTNKQFYKHIRQSTDPHSTGTFLSKISEIFDLVTLGISLPIEVQTFLARPLYELRGTLQRYGKNELSTTLTNFKNMCMNIYRVAPLSEIVLFNRIKLPTSNRWSAPGHMSRLRKEQEIQKRQRYYSSLRNKTKEGDKIDHSVLVRIESRLNEFLQKSAKYRRVFI